MAYAGDDGHRRAGAAAEAVEEASFVPLYSRPILQNLCNGSMRRRLVCQHRVSGAILAVDEFLATAGGHYGSVSNYMYLDALLVRRATAGLTPSMTTTMSAMCLTLQ